MTDSYPKLFFNNYKFLDCGNGRKLEDFAGVIVNRPAPIAVWDCAKPELWDSPAVYYSKDSGWAGDNFILEEWFLKTNNNLSLKLDLSSQGQVGVFPEHIKIAEDLIKSLAIESCNRNILNVFAYTGLMTLALAHFLSNSTITHVDASKPAVNWAKKNSEISGLANHKIYWVVDDAIKFLQREVKRGHKYNLIVLDPPAFGRSKSGGIWKLTKDLPTLLNLSKKLLVSKKGIISLTCHHSGWQLNNLQNIVEDNLDVKNAKIMSQSISLNSVLGFHSLPCGLNINIFFP